LQAHPRARPPLHRVAHRLARPYEILLALSIEDKHNTARHHAAPVGKPGGPMALHQCAIEQHQVHAVERRCQYRPHHIVAFHARGIARRRETLANQRLAERRVQRHQ